MHKSHGLHVHLVTNRFIDVNVALVLAKNAGWGRIHVQRIPMERAGYLAKYLSKQRPECLKRWRLWQASVPGSGPRFVISIPRSAASIKRVETGWAGKETKAFSSECALCNCWNSGPSKKGGLPGPHPSKSRIGCAVEKSCWATNTRSSVRFEVRHWSA